MRTIRIAATSLAEISLSSPASSSPADSSTAQPSPWHSPVPYLFGGLAAMLGFIAFALLILACSYWKFSARLQDREGTRRDLENGGDEKEGDSSGKRPAKIYEEKLLVIMAGDERPSFLATPASANIISLDQGIEKDMKKERIDDQHNDNQENKTEKEMSDRYQVSNPNQNQNQNMGDTDSLTTLEQTQL